MTSTRSRRKAAKPQELPPIAVEEEPELAEAELDADSEAEGETIVLPAHCGTAAAEDLLARLVIASDRDQDVSIDASAVQSVGQAVLQLLVAARIDARSVGQNFAIVRPTEAFLQRVHACLLTGALGLSSEAMHPAMTQVEDVVS